MPVAGLSERRLAPTGKVVISTVHIQLPILDGKVQIAGNFTGDEAAELTGLLRYGALAVKLKVESVSTLR